MDKRDDILPFNTSNLKAKYIEERELRLENGGLSQYRKVWEPSLLHYLEDCYVESKLKREQIIATYEVVIIGGGYAGLIVAVKLQEQGIDNIAIIERGSDFGGTWYWNRYPGAQCDVESYIYMPFLEETNYVPKEKYSHAPELFWHAQNIGRRFELYSKAIFQTEVNALRWSDEACIWNIDTDRNDHINARWVIPCPGNQSTPRFPGLPGIELFKGASFHTCRWDYSYTGGAEDGKLRQLQDKRIAIIGTGASAVQVVPRVAEWAGHLYVIQRTPSSISPRNNRATDETWARSLEPGWQRRRMENFYNITSGLDEPDMEDLVDDAWTYLLRAVAGGVARLENDNENDNEKDSKRVTRVTQNPEKVAEIMQLADFEIMERIRARVSREVQSARNPDTAQALKPWYNLLCKRPCFHDEYLQAFNRENVTLIDTKGRGVDAITEQGLVVKDQDIELDCIMYATGFEWQTKWTQRTGMQIYGKGGISITDKWATGTSTFHGWGVHGFPNLLLVTHSQSGLPVNYTHSVLDKGKHIAYVIGTCRSRGVRLVEPTYAAEKAWVEECVRLGASRNNFLAQCTPGYFNDEGAVEDRLSRANAYQGGPVAYERVLSAWREEGKLDGLLLLF